MIRWITDKLGTSAWDYANSLPGLYIVDVRKLVDKHGNTVDSITPPIADAVMHLKRGEKVVICCDYGISRSNSIAAGVLSVYEQIPVDEAIEKVLTATGESGIKLDVLDAVRQAIEPTKMAEKNNSTILVTGASGFIGSSIIKKLVQEKKKVITPSHHEIDLELDVVKLDLLVKQQATNIILHLATPRVYTTNASLGISLVMLKNVLDVCTQNNIKFYYLSSWEIYSGYKTEKLFADENLPARPGGTYGQTKYLSEVLIKHYIQHYGLDCIILRSSPVYGIQSERPRFIWNFLSKATQNQEILTHQYLNGFPALDLLHIDDLQTAVMAALNSHVTGEFNIGSGVGTTTTDVASLLIEKTRSKSKIQHVSIQDYASNIVMDCKKAKDVFGWQATRSISQGLDDYIQTLSHD
jgi:UDP-glucuronate decarboxylase